MSAQRQWAFERGTLWTLDLSETASPSSTAAPHSETVFAEANSADAVALATAMNMNIPLIARRFETGRRCFAAWRDGRIVTYGWVSQGVECVGELERVFRMQPREAYIWHCATLPPYRGQGLYSALLRHIVARLRDDGLQRVWIGAALDNRPSWRGFAHAGFQPIIKLAYVRLFQLRALWIISYPSAPPALVAAARRMIVADHERAWGAVALSSATIAQLPACAELEV
jgi:ribosomal protein S18 acetylase RimI-like enzyme